MTNIVQGVHFIQNVGAILVAKTIPSLKARAEWIPWALECIKVNAGNYLAMQECIVTIWRGLSQRTKSPSIKNSLRAVFGPTLRHLELVTGERLNVKLTAKGDELFNIYRSEGEAGFKKAFAKHLLKLDKERWLGLIFEIQCLGQPVSQDKLLRYLGEKYPDIKLSSDKLRKLLLHYVYTGLVALEGETILLREALLESISTGLEVKLSDEQFLEALNKAYKELSSDFLGSPYVPIPKIRDMVCRETKMWPVDFDRYLERLPRETSEYLIHLTEPMLRKPGGLRLAGKYLYYLAIYNKG